MQRIVFGALAGLSATMAMTAAMRRFNGWLDAGHHYPLPPREIIESIGAGRSDERRRAITMAAHFAYGALAGIVFTLPPVRRLGGTFYGIGVWAASYLGWIPSARILEGAEHHPAQRNLLMLAAHLVWGSALASGLRELERSADEIFADGPVRDAAGRESEEP